MALLDTETAREYLAGFDAVQDDDDLSPWLVAAESLCHTWLRYPRADDGSRELDSSTYTLYLDGPSMDDARRLDVGIWPLISVTSIADDADWDYANNIVSSSDYTVDANAGQVHLDRDASHTWSSATRAIRVITTAGYTTADKAVVAAVVLQARHMWNLRHTPGMPNAADTDDDPTTALAPVVRQILAPHRLWGAAFA